MKSLLIAVLLALCSVLAPAQVKAQSQALAAANKKLQHIQRNGTSVHPDPTPTILTEAEINAALASPEVELPQGIQSLRLHGNPGIVTANTRVDFDRLKAGGNSSNPVLSIFSGIHDVIINADAHGMNGQGIVHVNSVSLDGVGVPNVLLELLVEKYIQPKYPNIGIDSHFKLPDRISTAIVGTQKLTLVQK